MISGCSKRISPSNLGYSIVEASELAIKAYSKSLQATSYIAEESLHPITKIWIDIKSAIGGAWEQVKEFARSDVVLS